MNIVQTLLFLVFLWFMLPAYMVAACFHKEEAVMIFADKIMNWLDKA